jgi:uracil-DNA glycosylase
MLNTSLSVRAHQANSHSNKGWEQFTDSILQAIVSRPNLPGVVFFAWGNPAQKRIANLKELQGKAGADKHLVLKSVHPSPLSANKGPGFFGNGHFVKANTWLKERYGEQAVVDWGRLDPEEKEQEEGS